MGPCLSILFYPRFREPPPSYESLYPPILTRTGDPHSWYASICAIACQQNLWTLLRGIEDTLPKPRPPPLVSINSATSAHRTAFRRYLVEREKYDEQQERICAARTLLAETVSKDLWNQVGRWAHPHPCNAFTSVLFLVKVRVFSNPEDFDNDWIHTVMNVI